MRYTGGMVHRAPDRPNDETDIAWSAHDLRWVIDTALARGANLLSADEHAVIATLLALPDEPLEVYARWSARRYPIQRAEGPGLASLHDAGLLSATLNDLERLTPLTVAELRGVARFLALPRSGRRDALLDRLSAHIEKHGLASDAPIPSLVRVEHRPLVRRLERFAFLRPWPDRSTLVVERLGHVRWVDYPRTTGGGLFADRDALLRWEALLEPLPAEARLDALESGHHVGPGRLDLGRPLVRAILHDAREGERAALRLEPAEQADALRTTEQLYRRVHDVAVQSPRLARYATRAAIRRARVLEHLDRPRAGLAVLVEHRPRTRHAGRLALNRAGRRLTRSIRGRHLGTGWVPDRPLAPLRERRLKLDRVDGPPDANRPRWSVAPSDEAHVVEHAVIALLAAQGREAVHAEGGLWRTLVTLLLAPDCLFLPIPGQLPVARLSAPLDYGTPGFAARRVDAIDRVRAQIDEGRAADLVRRAYDAFEGCRLAGCRWADAESHARIAAALPPALLRMVFDTLLAEGPHAAKGMPDLLVLPGPAAKLPRAIPGRVGPGVVLAEVKGPSDTLSDAQRIWLDRVADCGARVEVWHVGS
jgi:hypothetical protein